MTETSHGPTIELLKAGLGALGYSHDSFKLGGIKFTEFTSPSGRKWLTQDNRISYPFVSTTARRVSTFKNIGYDLAARLGAQVPVTQCIVAGEQASDNFESILKHAPLVVKPNSASLSRGLTLNVMNLDQLREAIKKAEAFDTQVLIQKQLDGDEIRFMVVNNKVKAALLRQTPRVIGDGVHKLSELIELENQARSAIDVPYLTYPQLTSPLIDLSGLDLTYVPNDQEIIELGRGTMIATGASVYNVLDSVHPEYVTLAEKLATALGSGFVSVDIFIKDYTQPLNPQDYAFIEYNMSPVLKLVYSCRDAQHYDILSDLIPFIDTVIDGNHHDKI